VPTSFFPLVRSRVKITPEPFLEADVFHGRHLYITEQERRKETPFGATQHEHIDFGVK